MKLGIVIKLDKKNTTKPRNNDDVMSENCHVIVFFPFYGQFSAFGKPDSGYMIYKTYIFNNNNLLSYKS